MSVQRGFGQTPLHLKHPPPSAGARVLRVVLGTTVAMITIGALGGPTASGAASSDYCDGFDDPPTPTLSAPAFIQHVVPGSYDFIPPAVADFNNDGRPDLPYLENLGHFQFQARPEFGDAMRSVLTDTITPQTLHGIAVADFDGDGQPDLIVAPYKSPWEQQMIPPLMVHNLGDWNFDLSNLPFLKNLLGYAPYQPWYSENIVAADFTGDGINDYFIPFYSWTAPYQSAYLHTTPAGLSEEAVARGLGLQGVPPGFDAEGAQTVDINNDGYLDLYTGHHLFINDGTGHFTDHAADYGLPAIADEGVVFVDYNNDGLPDLYIRTVNVSQQLWRNTGHGFVSDSVTSGLACMAQAYGFFYGDVWADFNRDGYLDLFYMVSDPVDPNVHQFLLILNQGNGTFRLGWVGPWYMQLAAVADFDSDGDLDVAGLGSISENVIPPPTNVYNLVVTLEDAKGIRNQQGSTIWVTSQCSDTPAIQTRVIGSGGSAYLAQSDYSAHFALDRRCAYQVKVSFPARASQPLDVESIDFTPTHGTSTELVVQRDTDVQLIDRTPVWDYFPLVAR